MKVALDYLTIKPIGSHVRNASVATEVPTQVQATHYRYCIHAPEFPTKVNCFDDKAVIDDLKLNEVKIWELENTSTWWHRVQMAGLVQLPQSKPPPIGAPDGPLVYGAGEYSRVWNWPSDFERWHGSAWGAWVPDASTAFKTDDPKFLPPQGRFWIHADGEIGTVDLTLGTGMHGKKDALADPAESLANHYQPIAPFSSWVLKQAPTKPIFVYRECYLCGPPIKPSGDMCPNCSMEIMPELPSVVSRVIASTPDGTVGVTSRSGALIPLRADPAAYLMQSLALGPVWVDQAEPSAYLGKSRSAPIAVGIDPSSGALVEQVFVAAGRLLGAADLRSTDEVPGIAVQSSLEASPGRTGFVPVYSRALSRVFLVGGTDETGAIASDIVWKSLDAAPWQHVPTGGYVPGHVLAATYHAADNMLWILDEVGALTEGARVRLTRLDPVSGKGELLGEWPRMNNFTEYWLRSDRDGSMLAFASSDKTHSHAIARLSAANASLTAIGFKVRAGALVEAPVVDMAGYWLTREQGNKKRQVERLTELPLLEVGWLDQIGQCF